MPTRKRTITEADRAAAKKLRELWAQYQRDHPGVSQEAAAGQIGFTQSAFSQFVLGRMPIRVGPALKFARFFGVPPTLIRADLVDLAYHIGEAKAGTLRDAAVPELSAAALEVGKAFMKLAPATQQWIRELVFIHAVIDRQYPWLRRGKPATETYDKWERGIENNMAAMITLAAARTGARKK